MLGVRGQRPRCLVLASGQGLGQRLIQISDDIVCVFDPDGDPETVDDVPDVVQNSWRTYGALGYPECFDLWWGAIDNLERFRLPGRVCS